MAFCRRINQSKLQLISNQCRRFYFQAPYASSLDQTRISILGSPVSSVEKKPSYFYNNVRYFAAPIQAKKNVKEEVSEGPRLNEQITAKFIRLVTDEDHAIVSIDEALERAKKLGLDLVEVQRMGNPPVCKLMDFYQERFKQRAREKDRAKSKSGETLKKGDCKEIRFTEKIEAKDLKLKAETATRLMERGYRVKCTAMGKGKEDEDENLGGLLSRLTDLIKDVAFMETAPRVERKQAYVIVRHVKFGPSKKTGGKSSKVVGDTKAEHPDKSGADRQDPLVPGDDSIESISESENEMLLGEHDLPTSSPMQMQDKSTWTVSEPADDFDKLFNLAGGVSSNSTGKEIHAIQQTAPSSVKFLHPKSSANSTGSNNSGSSRPEASVGIENRHKQFPPARSVDRMGQSTREQVRSEPRFTYQQQRPPQNMNAYQRQQQPQNMNAYQRQQPPQNANADYRWQQPPQNANADYRWQQPAQNMNGYQRQQPPHNMNVSSSVGETKRVRNDASLSRNSTPSGINLPKQQPSRTDVPGKPAPSFGIFSTPNPCSSGKQGTAADAHGSNEGNRSASAGNRGMVGNGASQNFPGSESDSGQRLNPDGNMGAKDRFGIFSRDSSSSTQNRMPKSN